MNWEKFVEKNAPKNRIALLAIADILIVSLAGFLALYIRFDFSFQNMEWQFMRWELRYLPLHIGTALILFAALKLYRSVWQFASATELLRAIAASTAAMIAEIIYLYFLRVHMPLSYYPLKFMIMTIGVVGIRFFYRFLRMWEGFQVRDKDEKKHTMIVGGGEAGAMVIREFQTSKWLDQQICRIIDDDPRKQGKYIRSIEVVGGTDEIPYFVEKYKIDEIIVAMPSVPKTITRDILNICKETECELRVLPGVYQMISGDVSVSKLRKVEIEDLLGRDQIKVNMDEIFQYLKGKTILVTGGGGSIGSELCRQIAGHAPKQLIIFDIYENNAYEIEQELKRKYPSLNLTVLIGSVRDSRRINWVFEQYKPDIVYHAAAHKHVPLMETSPNEAIKNNVVGTYKTAYAALMNGTKRFVLISTDKAVNPTNIMGASKRLCEMVIQSMDAVSQENRIDLLPFLHAHMEKKTESAKKTDGIRTQFVAVRFGNVLGSNGSVIPLFKKQIEAGGPVTVTHPDIIRYFMTIPEAVSLVLQAGTYAQGGEIFVLDMGAPVKIDSLARNLIRLSGYKPDEDIKIEYTGLRPGEKLYEEKLMAEEGMKRTDNELIHIGQPIPFDTEKFLRQLEKLAEASYENSEEIVQMAVEIVPTFHPVGANPSGKELG